jgi:hypothetical protein
MRLIDADALLRRYDEEHVGPPGKARKLIEEAPTACGWISVKDDLPKKFGEPCIVYNGCSVQYGDYYSDGIWYTPDCYESEEIRDVTHWMPMPEPPKEE